MKNRKLLKNILRIISSINDNLFTIFDCYLNHKSPVICGMTCYYRKLCEYVYQESEILLKKMKK